MDKSLITPREVPPLDELLKPKPEVTKKANVDKFDPRSRNQFGGSAKSFQNVNKTTAVRRYT